MRYSRRPPLGVRLFLPISLRSLSPILAATFMLPRGRPTLVVLSLVASSSVASLSSLVSPLSSRIVCRSNPIIKLSFTPCTLKKEMSDLGRRSGGFYQSITQILWKAANVLQNKLTRAQYLDEVTWTTKNWLGLQKQRISVVLHTAIAEQVVNELACGGGGRVHGAKCLATLAGVA